MIDLAHVCSAVAAGMHRTLTIDPARLRRLTRCPATEPYFGREKTYRFDDPMQAFGVTYAAERMEVAFAETVLHESGAFDHGRWLIAEKKVLERHVVTYRTLDARSLRLADFTGAGLKRLGLNNDISASDDYSVSMAVARIVFEKTDLDGIAYVSRQYNSERAVAIFDRSDLLATLVTPLVLHPQYGYLLEHFHVELLPSTAAPGARRA